MTTLLNGTTNTSGSSGAVSNAISGNGELSTLFTTLLVAQIRNQNPLEPQDPSAFVNQLTQLSQTESLQNLARQGAASASMMESMQVLSLGSQVGSQLMINTDKVTVGTEKIDGVVTLENASATTAVVLKAADGAETRITLGTLPRRSRLLDRPGQAGLEARQLHDEGRDLGRTETPHRDRRHARERQALDGRRRRAERQPPRRSRSRLRHPFQWPPAGRHQLKGNPMSFDIALSGINSVNAQLDTISNNIANSGTYGFKSSRVNFTSTYAGTQSTGSEVGSLTQSISAGGSVLTTGRGMDASIQGRGFFTSRDSAGNTLYHRVGIFSKDKEGYIIDSLGRRAQGFAAIPGSTALGPMGDLQVPTGQIAAQASTQMKYTGNLSSDWTTPTVAVFDPAEPRSFNGSMVSVVYDSLGAQHSVTQYFVKTGTNQVTVHYTMDGAAVPGTSTLNFGTDGKLSTPAAPVAVALPTPAGAAPFAVTMDYAGSTSYSGEATTSANSANGYASGTLIDVEINDEGQVVAKYSNNEKQVVGTLALATFPDEGALIAVSGTSWTTSNASGTPLYFAPGSGMAGTLTSGAVEQSNVDITAELVGLMSAQRNYQANAKVISTENQMVQALMQAV